MRAKCLLRQRRIALGQFQCRNPGLHDRQDDCGLFRNKRLLPEAFWRGGLDEVVLRLRMTSGENEDGLTVGWIKLKTVVGKGRGLARVSGRFAQALGPLGATASAVSIYLQSTAGAVQKA